MNKLDFSLREAFQALEKKSLTAVELTEGYIERISSLDTKYNAFLQVCPEKALATAKQADHLREGQEMCWLTGVPGAVKDSIITQGVATTAASKILENFNPPYNATVIDRLDSVYSPILGKTNLDEFAMGSSTENSAYKVTSNPWDLDRVSGGTSGGSAAAVAADMCVYALGSDTGGSIRQPSAFCGVVGLKPTYGRVSRYGLIAYGSSLDCIGPITKTVEDAALVLNIIAGKDSNDATSSKEPIKDYSFDLEKDIKGIKVGIPKEFFVRGLQKEVEETVRNTIKILERSGAIISDVSLPHTEAALSAYYITATSEASSNLSRYDGIRYGNGREYFGTEVKRRIILGTYSLSSGYYDAYYLKAAKVRTLIKRDYETVFKKVDCLITPVAPTVAFKKGEKNTPLEMYLSDVFTIPANLAGIPALSMPCGFVDNLPVGVQLMGPHFSEELLLLVGHRLEAELNLRERKPPL